MNYQVKHIGQHRGNARLWFETQQLETVGLTRGTRYRAHWSDDHKAFVIMADPQGKRIVSGKDKGGKSIPIIDINDDAVLGKLATEPAVKVQFITEGATPKYIKITKLSSAEMQHARANRLCKSLAAMALTVAALCFGGGAMDNAAAQGLHDAGFKTELTTAVEINADLLDHAVQYNPVVTPRTKLIAAPMQELVQDDEAMLALERADVLVTGIPCSGASISGKSKLGLVCAEDHPEVGHLVVPYIMLIQRFQPLVSVTECVVPYSKTVSAMLLRQMYRDMGYTVHEVELDSWDFGSIEQRKRWFLVAATHGIDMDLTNLAPRLVQRPKLGDFLEAGTHSWSKMEGLKAKEVRDKAAGKGFMMQIVNEDSPKIGTIGKDYMKNRSTEPKVQHPESPEYLRLLTPTEHARIKGFPPELVQGLSATSAHQLLGQAVDARPVRALFRRIGECVSRSKGNKGVSVVSYSLERATG